MRRLLPLLALLPAAPAAAQDSTQVWGNLIALGQVADGVTAEGDVTLRSRDGWDGLRQSLVRATVLVEVADGLRIGGGYSHFFDTPERGRDTNDAVPFAQANYAVGRIGPGTLSTRTRLEVRMRSNDPDTSYRLRQLVAYAIPLGEGLPTLSLSEEAFFELADTAGGLRSGYVQSFAAASLGFDLGRVTVAPGYLAFIRNVPGPNPVAHVLNLTATARF